MLVIIEISVWRYVIGKSVLMIFDKYSKYGDQVKTEVWDKRILCINSRRYYREIYKKYIQVNSPYRANFQEILEVLVGV